MAAISDAMLKAEIRKARVPTLRRKKSSSVPREYETVDRRHNSPLRVKY